MTTSDDFRLLFQNGLLGKAEFYDGRILIGFRYAMVFDPEHARLADDYQSEYERLQRETGAHADDDTGHGARGTGHGHE
jgi:hypothetical protein